MKVLYDYAKHCPIGSFERNDKNMQWTVQEEENQPIVYCKNCYKDRPTLTLEEKYKDEPWTYMLICAYCRYGLTPPGPATKVLSDLLKY